MDIFSLRRTLLICAAGIGLSIAVYFAFRVEGEIWQYLLVPTSLLATLTGRAMQTDIAQDFYGLRALVGGFDPYPPLRVVYDSIGFSWDLTQPSTHPPTAFLLTAPAAWLPWRLASALWAWGMLAAVAASFRLYGLTWKRALQLTAIGLLWPPLTASLGQLTPLWLLGIALAYHFRDRRPFAAGAWLGFAALTKFLPGVFLALFIVRKKWSAVLGFAAVWVAALGILLVVAPDSIIRYLEVSRSETMATITRPDNAALITATLVRYGPLLAGAAAAFLLCLALANYADWFLSETISPRAWMLFSFFGVALLPIAWVYSLLPLMPDVFSRMNATQRYAWLAAAAAVVVISMPLYGITTYLYMTAFFLLYGASFLFDQKITPSKA